MDHFDSIQPWFSCFRSQMSEILSAKELAKCWHKASAQLFLLGLSNLLSNYFFPFLLSLFFFVYFRDMRRLILKQIEWIKLLFLDCLVLILR